MPGSSLAIFRMLTTTKSFEPPDWQRMGGPTKTLRTAGGPPPRLILSG